MATSSETYVGIDVSKGRLDVAVLGEERGWQVDNTQEGIAKLVQQMQEVCPELIVVEATGARIVSPHYFGMRRSSETSNSAPQFLHVSPPNKS